MAKKANPLWHVRTRDIDEFVRAPDALAAMDTLRERSIYDFGLIVEAEPDEQGDGEAIPCRTSMLMFRWGRKRDAEKFIKLGIEHGFPDTTELDSAECIR